MASDTLSKIAPQTLERAYVEGNPVPFKVQAVSAAARLEQRQWEEDAAIHSGPTAPLTKIQAGPQFGWILHVSFVVW